MSTPHFKKILPLLFFLTILSSGSGQEKPQEAEYYRITTIPVPEGIHLEAGGVAAMPDGSAAVCTRRGDVWIVRNPTMSGGTEPTFDLFAQGLHEPLGLAYLDGAFYTAQRGELTKLMDIDGDWVADNYETVYAWPTSGHYHEYSFGPVITSDTSFFVTGNIAFGDEEWWRGESRVPWRGWTMKISKEGTLEPWATGMRSPAGIGIIEGELFYTENQGDWVGSGGLWHLPKGVFSGHPAGLRWTGEPDSPLKLTAEQVYEHVDPRKVKKEGVYIKPENIPDEKDPTFLFEMKEKIPEYQLPAVILPHGILGISNSQPIVDNTGGKFGPFTGQIFVGDQGQSKIMRVVLEKVNGEYQGVAFDFRAGFQSGVLRLDWDSQGNLFVGETNRGWGSAGVTNSGLEYVTWTGEVPFEMHTVKAAPDGFEIIFTKPVDPASAKNLNSYSGKSFIYKYHPVYGSPPVNIKDLTIKGVKLSDDGMKLRVVIDNLRRYYLHEFMALGIKAAKTGESLLHPAFYYTLNNIPEGPKLPENELFTRRTPKESKATVKPKPAKSKVAALSDEDIQPLLVKNTCTACHRKDQRVVGPPFTAIAKRNYSDEKIVELIYSPEPKNWPEYATPMAPMPQVPKDEALKIAAWINSLD